MIDYRLFTFSTPPLTGEDWFTLACDKAGLGHWPEAFAVTSFPLLKKNNGALRVSLVRHPCDWLWFVYNQAFHGSLNLLSHFPIGLEVNGGFDSFVTSYLKVKPGAITKLFNSYNCDTRMRIEDMPNALVEFLESVDVPDSMVTRVKKVEVVPAKIGEHLAYKWNQYLRSQVLKVERGIVDEFDYY